MPFFDFSWLFAVNALPSLDIPLSCQNQIEVVACTFPFHLILVEYDLVLLLYFLVVKVNWRKIRLIVKQTADCNNLVRLLCWLLILLLSYRGVLCDYFA